MYGSNRRLTGYCFFHITWGQIYGRYNRSPSEFHFKCDTEGEWEDINSLKPEEVPDKIKIIKREYKLHKI